MRGAIGKVDRQSAGAGDAGLHVDPETRRVTTRCDKNFSCLAGSRDRLCKVEECVDGNLHFVQCEHGQACAYQVMFGARCLCSCPTRREIHDRYGY
jgi:hypothetical protein